ncbi:MAG: glycosyl hydrolase [Planctomycetes bacterium]|nr:glycosyl hydrolase [Planctomycetota bacterium]
MKRCAAVLFALFFVAPSFAQDAKDPFKQLKFRSIGPAAGGRVSRACGIPGNPLIYYMATASGGVWKSDDAGHVWKPIFDDQPTSSIGAIAVADSDPNVVYVGSGEANIRGNVQPGNGIYVSTDAGKTWKHVWKQEGQISRIVVHPKNATVAYAAVLGRAFGPNPERGVYRTSDGGKSWQQILKKDADTGAIDIVMDPSNPRILFAAMWQARRTPWGFSSGGPGSGLYRSSDGGDTWKRVGTPQREGEAPAETQSEGGLPTGPLGRIGLGISSDGQRVYALIEAAGDKGGLYRSDDGGDNWKLMNNRHYLRIRPWYFSVVAVDPSNPDVVWCPSLYMLKSIDGGKSFKKIKGPHHVDHHDLWIDPRNPRRMIDSNDGGVDITLNGGKTWHAPPLPICQFYHINCDNRVPYHVSGTMQDLGTASGPSNSLSDDGIAPGYWYGVGGGETGYTMPDPTDPDIVYAGEYGGYISRFNFRTRQARNVSIYPANPSGHGAKDMRYRFQWTAPILISPHDPKTVYHAANVLFKTTDQGKTWKAISPDLTRDDKSKQQRSGGPITGDNTGAEYYCTIFAIAESPKQAGVLWAGSDDGLVHLSRDAGKTWTNVTKNIPGMPEWGTVCCIEASRRDAGTAYVVVDAHRLDDQRPYLYKTSDFGVTWEKLSSKLPQDDSLRVVREDPAAPGMLYVGSEHGIHYARDGGASWKKLKLNLPTVAVSDLVVKGDDLVVGTNGRSIWILDDLTPIRQFKPGTQLLPAAPAIRWRYHSEIYGTDSKIAGANPPAGAILHYILDKKAGKDLTLTIEDEEGKAVQTLSSKKPATELPEDDPDAPGEGYKKPVLGSDIGVNRVVWDLRHAGARIIPNAKNDGGNPARGPLVEPGKYTVKLTVDGKTLTTPLIVKMDPRVKIDLDTLAEQTKATMRLRSEISKLADMVIRLQKSRAGLKAGKLSPMAKKLIERIDGLEDRLHNSKAQVTYDILALGSKLYSKQGALYEWLKDSDGPVTQGMREVHAELARELAELTREFDDISAAVARYNDEAK